MKFLSRQREWLKRIAGKLPRPEWTLLLSLALIALAAWAFLEIADEVTEGETAALDEKILLALRAADDASDPIGPRWVEEAARDVTALGSLAVLVIVVTSACGYLWLKGNRTAVLYVIVAVLGAQALSSGLKLAFDRPRPDLVPHGDFVYTQSFPSGHSLVSAATYLTLGAMLAKNERKRRLQIYFVLWAITLAVLVGISRVYLGVHWPTDVAAGWAIGAFWALMCWTIARYLGTQKLRAADSNSKNTA